MWYVLDSLHFGGAIKCRLKVHELNCREMSEVITASQFDIIFSKSLSALYRIAGIFRGGNISRFAVVFVQATIFAG